MPWFADVGMLYWRTDLVRAARALRRPGSRGGAGPRRAGLRYGLVWQERATRGWSPPSWNTSAAMAGASWKAGASWWGRWRARGADRDDGRAVRQRHPSPPPSSPGMRKRPASPFRTARPHSCETGPTPTG
jgi:hypothetical protein